jgi:hypothetical protein
LTDASGSRPDVLDMDTSFERREFELRKIEESNPSVRRDRQPDPFREKEFREPLFVEGLFSEDRIEEPRVNERLSNEPADIVACLDKKGSARL